MSRFFICFTILTSSLICGEPEISVIVPCYHGHFHHLEGLLTELAKQTLIPDEVVVALSEADLIDPEEIVNLQNQEWPFCLKLITSSEKHFAGINRNIACENAEGNILICQDADDLPHVQRIEIIKRIFDLYHPDQVMHQYYRDSGEFYEWVIHDLDQLPFNWFRSWKRLLCYEGPIHHGNIAIKRSVLERVKWSQLRRGQDVEFNKKCIERLQNTLMVDLPLLIYRPQYSSWNQ